MVSSHLRDESRKRSQKKNNHEETHALLADLILNQSKTTTGIVITKADENIETGQSKNSNIANEYEEREREGEVPVIFLVFARRESVDSVGDQSVEFLK